MTETKSLNDVLDLFKDSVSPQDVIEAALDAKISSEITNIRLSHGMTQRDFAEKIGVKQSQVSKWENGTCNYNISTLAKIIAAFDLDIDICIREKKKPAKLQKISHFSASKLNGFRYEGSGYKNAQKVTEAKVYLEG